MNDAELEKEFSLKAHGRLATRIAFDNEATVSVAILTLKSLLLINGGASIAMLGFVSSLVGKDNMVIVAAADPIIWFALGVVASVLACCVAYAVMYFQAAYSQSLKTVEKSPYVVTGEKSVGIMRWANALQVLAVLVAFISLIFFFIGILSVSCAIDAAFQISIVDKLK